jgi:hypothetical protein
MPLNSFGQLTFLPWPLTLIYEIIQPDFVSQHLMKISICIFKVLYWDMEVMKRYDYVCGSGLIRHDQLRCDLYRYAAGHHLQLVPNASRVKMYCLVWKIL